MRYLGNHFLLVGINKVIALRDQIMAAEELVRHQRIGVSEAIIATKVLQEAEDEHIDRDQPISNKRLLTQIRVIGTNGEHGSCSRCYSLFYVRVEFLCLLLIIDVDLYFDRDNP